MTSHQSDWATLPNPAVRQVLVALTTTTGGCNADVLQTRLVCKAWQQEVDYFVTDIGVRRRSLLFGSQFALERYGGYMYADIAHCASASGGWQPQLVADFLFLLYGIHPSRITLTLT
jgi:hypothetical protein